MNANNLPKIDVHHASARYAIALARLTADTSISPVNKGYLLEYLAACSLGKTILDGQKKKIREKRLLKYLYTLRQISAWLGNKDFRHISQQDMEQFISRLEADQLTVLRSGTMVPARYADWSRRDIKVTLRKFYKWLLGDGRQCPSVVAWIDTHIDKAPPDSLSLDEIRRCVDFASSARTKALCWALFETGARAEEFLNVRIRDLEQISSHFLVRIDYPKTFKRIVPVFDGAPYLREWLAQHPNRHDAAGQLFPMGYSALAKLLRRLGHRVLGKRITPHLFRHSFATWLATKKVGRYQMCKLMGWAMSSDMPDRYIDRIGLVEQEAIEGIRGDGLSKLERENGELRTTLKRVEAQYNDLQEQLGKRAEVDNFMAAVLKDRELRDRFVESVKAQGLGKRLLEL